MTEETTTLLTMIRHRAIVSNLLRDFARLLWKRADLHDLSKFEADEFEGFLAINKIAREHAYQSEQYKESLAAQQDIIDLHYSRNSHHPQHYAGGINDMPVTDVIEMVADWIGAALTYNKLGDAYAGVVTGIEQSLKRFGANQATSAMVWMVAEFMLKESGLHQLQRKDGHDALFFG